MVGQGHRAPGARVSTGGRSLSTITIIMLSRRPAPPRSLFIAAPVKGAGAPLPGRPSAQVFRPHVPRWGALAVLLLASTAVAAETGVPLPPSRPAAVATKPAPPSARRLRAAPLPPPRPAEIEALRAAEEEATEEAPAAPAQPPAFSARSEPPTGFPNLFASPSPPPEDAAPAAPETAAPAGGPAPGELPEACAALVAEGAMIAVAEKPISNGGSCGIARPVRLSAVRISESRMAALKPEAVVTCEVAAAVTSWVREDLAPAVRALGSEIDTVRVAASYDCRGRNRIAGARMSEHGLGKALDVGGFELADRRVVLVEQGGLPRDLRVRMKGSACRRFDTVLGPGSDGYHEDHIHVDLAQRARDFKLCRWNIDAPTLVAGKKERGKSSDAAKPPVEAPQAGGQSGAAASDAEPADARPADAGKADAKPGTAKASGGKANAGKPPATPGGKSSTGAAKSPGPRPAGEKASGSRSTGSRPAEGKPAEAAPGAGSPAGGTETKR